MKLFNMFKNLFNNNNNKKETYSFRIVKNLRKGWKVYVTDEVADDGSWYVKTIISDEKPAGYPEDTGIYEVLFGEAVAYFETSNPKEVMEWVKKNTKAGEEYQLQMWKPGFSDYIRVDMNSLKNGEFKISNKTSAMV